MLQYVAIGYSWLDVVLRNPWSGVQPPQVLGCSGLRAAEPLVRGSNPYGAGGSLRGWGLGSHMSNQGTHWRRFPAQGTVGWRVASRTLGQGFKPLSGSAVGGWGPTCPIRVHLSVEILGSTQQRGLHLIVAVKTIRPSRNRTPGIVPH